MTRLVALCLACMSCASQVGCDMPPDSGPAVDHGLFGDPSDFDHSACPGERPIAELSPTGIWHLDLDFGFDGTFAGAARIDVAGEGLTGVLLGRDQSTVVHTATDLYMRRTWLTANNTIRLQALNACAVDADGALRGQFASCRDDDCFVADLRMVRVEPLDEPVAEGLALAGELGWDGGITLNVRAAGGLAYLVRGTDGLRIVDVSTPEAPVELGHLPVELAGDEFYNDVKIVVGSDEKPYVLVASTTRGVVVIDASDPRQPIEVTSFPPPPQGEARIEVHTLFIDGDRAYLANVTTGGLDIYDVSDPRAPARLGAFVLPQVEQVGGLLHDLYVEGGRAYLSYWNHGMVIVDTLEDPSAPTVVGTFDAYERRTSHSSWVTTAGGRRVAIHGDEDFGAHVRIIDVDDESVAFLDVLGTYQTRPEVSVHNIMAAGELALVTYYQDGLRLLDLADPTAPLEIAHFHTWDPSSSLGNSYGYSFFEGAIGVDYDPDSQVIYLADTHRDLLILRRLP
ncbi:MAG TPA: hypothetical protein VML75_09755 [Kofleriaceae bacterium]|nr:hypothetical protein [Kofleriaceae bacterium]